MAVELITAAEYARRRGVSRAAVTIAVKAGRIVLIDGKIDPAVADIQWERNTRKAVGRGGQAATTVHTPAVNDDPALGTDAPPSAGAYDYDAARAKREHHESMLAEMRERERQQQLVEVARVKLAVADIVRVIADGLERVPDRLVAQVHPGMTQADIHIYLEREITAVRNDLHAAVSGLARRLSDAEAA